MMHLRILVVDDYEAWRKRIRAILEPWPELDVIGEASDGLEALQKAEELRPDIILLDIGIRIAHRNLMAVKPVICRVGKARTCPCVPTRGP